MSESDTHNKGLKVLFIPKALAFYCSADKFDSFALFYFRDFFKKISLFKSILLFEIFY